MLQLSNSTPFAGTITVLPDVEGVDTIFTIVKATFTLGPELTLAPEQVPVAMTDAHHGDPASTSIRTPGDVCLGKAATDVVLIGSAYAPGGQPIWQMDVALSVGEYTKTVRVSGDRVWERRGGVVAAAWVAPFVRMPLVWERAFGGSVDAEKGPRIDPRNPVGVGLAAHSAAGGPVGLPLPNVEDPSATVTGPGDSAPPAGFAPIAPHWEPRRSYAGTYDEAWQANRAPYLPHDFDRRFFQQAPPGLTMPGFLRGGERIELRGVTPGGYLAISLPTLRIQVQHRLDDRAESRPGMLETVLLEPDQARMVLVWRSAFRCDKKALRVREIEATVTA